MARLMKESGIEWIGEIPQKWKTCEIKRYCNDIYAGGTPQSNNPLFWDGEIKWIPSGCCHDNVICSAPKTITKEGYESSSTKLIPANTALVAMTGATCGNTGYLTIESCANQSVTAYIEDKEICDSLFLWYLLQAAKEYLLTFQTGGAQGGVNVENCKNIIVPFVPKSEQITISHYIQKKCSEIDSVIAETEKTIEEYKKLKQSIITEAVTKGIRDNRPMKDSGIEWIGDIPEEWEVQKFKNLGKCRNGLTYSPENQVDENGTLVLRSSNIQEGKLDLSDCVFVDKDIPSELMVKPGDILICSRNGSAKLIGKNVIIPIGITASFGAFMMIYRCNTPNYLQYILSSSIFSYYLGTFLTVSVNQLTGNNFDNIQFPYTSDTNEQIEIVSFLDSKCKEIDGLIKVKRQLLTELQGYKKSLIYEYVTGKKEVPNGN